MIRHDFGSIHDALNKMIIGEVKAALRLVPEQMHQGASLCRIVVSDGDDYAPKDVAVDMVWLHHDKLYFSGHIMPPDWRDPNDDPEQFEGGEGDEENAETNWLDITDFQYLIEQMKDLMPESEDSHLWDEYDEFLTFCCEFPDDKECRDIYPCEYSHEVAIRDTLAQLDVISNMNENK